MELKEILKLPVEHTGNLEAFLKQYSFQEEMGETVISVVRMLQFVKATQVKLDKAIEAIKYAKEQAELANNWKVSDTMDEALKELEK